jgi:hypothetical protein
MTTTYEEALEQGWHSPVPTFFGQLNEGGTTDAYDFFRQCPNSVWAMTELTNPKPVLDDGHPNVRRVLAELEARRGKPIGPEGLQERLVASLPHYDPLPRPLKYQRLNAMRGYR